MILIGLSNQHVLGRFIMGHGPIRLSNHHGASEGIPWVEGAPLKETALKKSVRLFASLLHGPEPSKSHLHSSSSDPKS